MRKVLIVSERFWPEDFIINDLSQEMVQKGYIVEVLTQQPSYPKGKCFPGRRNLFINLESWKGVTIHRFKTVLGYRDSLFYKLLNYLWFCMMGSFRILFLGRKYDQILVYQTGPLSQVVPAILASRLHRVPLVVWTQDVWPDSVYAYGFKKRGLLPVLLNAFVRRTYKACSSVLISCEGFEKVLRSYYEGRFVYAPNWPLSVYEPGGNSAPDAFSGPLFLFAGNIGKVQNLENVIKGFAIAHRSGEFKGRLRIVGDGSHLQNLRQFALDNAIPVEFPGRKHPDQMSEEYRQANFLVLSLDDKPVFRLTVPSKFQMYLSVGKPILCAAAGEVVDLVLKNNLGLVAAADSPYDIALQFVAMGKATKDRVEEWVENSQFLLRKKFQRDVVIGNICAELDRVHLMDLNTVRKRHRFNV